VGDSGEMKRDSTSRATLNDRLDVWGNKVDTDSSPA